MTQTSHLEFLIVFLITKHFSSSPTPLTFHESKENFFRNIKKQMTSTQLLTELIRLVPDPHPKASPHLIQNPDQGLLPQPPYLLMLFLQNA